MSLYTGYDCCAGDTAVSLVTSASIFNTPQKSEPGTPELLAGNYGRSELLAGNYGRSELLARNYVRSEPGKLWCLFGDV
jgi:hypothetical protein